MHPDPIETPQSDGKLSEAEFQGHIDTTREYMYLLLETGFPVLDVLNKGLQFAFACYHYRAKSQYDWNASQLHAAKVTREAAKNLGIDAEAQCHATQSLTKL